MLDSSRVLVTPEGHIDVTRRADICANVTADTAGIVGGDVAAHGLAVFRNPVDCILRTVNDTVIAFETHSATHATTGLFDRLGFTEAARTLGEIAQYML